MYVAGLRQKYLKIRVDVQQGAHLHRNLKFLSPNHDNEHLLHPYNVPETNVKYLLSTVSFNHHKNP